MAVLKMKNKPPYRIAIAGIGGIGGYLGGKLAHYYQHSTRVQVSFICRGDHADAIRERGLVLFSEEQRLHAVPHELVSDPANLAPVDALIMCVKTFDSEALLRACAPIISNETVILTTQNTVEFNGALEPLVQKGTAIFEGAMYIAVRKVEPGVVHHFSGPAQYVFGTNGGGSERGRTIENLLTKAGIQAEFSEKMQAVLWKKFLFLSPAAVVTALKGISIPEILQKEERTTLYCSLFLELRQIAQQKSVDLQEVTLQTHLETLSRFSVGVKTSFQKDLEDNNKSEVGALVEYVLREALELGISVPHYTQALKSLQIKYPRILMQ